MTIRGDGKSAVEHSRRSCDCLEQAQVAVLSGYARAQLGCAYYLAGQFQAARDHALRGLTEHRGSGNPHLLSLCNLYLAVAHFGLGAWEDAQQCADEALRLSQQLSEKYTEGASRLWLGRVLAKRHPPEYERAEASIVEGLRVLQERQLKPIAAEGYLYLAEVRGEMGKIAEAREDLVQARRMFTEMGMAYYLSQAEEVWARLQG